MRRALGLGLTCWIVLLALLPAVAGAHAVLDGTSPGRGAQLERAPGEVVLRFDEPVEIAFGAVRVYGQDGGRVDRGSATHPDGRGESVAVALRDGLGDGTYTATYRVVSGDSHPIAGGFVFSVGQGGAPPATVDELIDAADMGPVTDAGFGIVRVLSYLALALTVGGVAFALTVWRPLVPHRLEGRWPAANEAFARRASTLLLAGVGLGIATSAAGIVFQGAVAGGTAIWAAIDANVIGDVLETRFGTVWAERLLVYLMAGALLLHRPLRGLLFASDRRGGGEGALGVLAILLLALCLMPALAGHASTFDPGWLLIPASALHVLCMSIWVGGIAVLLLALPAATSQLEPGQRTVLLAGAVSRFSTVALLAVAGLVLGGVVQAVLELDALPDLTGTAFGRAILIKVGLLGGLIALGAWNRQRSRPRLAALADGGESPGVAGVVLRRSLRAEGVLMVAVLTVTAALVSYSPAAGAGGPFSASESLGPARLELTVDPARAGRNSVHLYLFDRRSGGQFDRTRELTVTARLPSEGIGPLTLEPRKAGPGHYVIRRADIAPPGEWRLDVDVRITAFDSFSTRVEVPIK